MRPLFIAILISFFGPSLGLAQQLKNYRVVLGNYDFVTETTFETDTLNNNMPREYSYLFKNKQQVIQIPRRIDTIAVYDISNPNLKPTIRIDTVDRIMVNKIVDTISAIQLTKIINSEIHIYFGDNKLKFDEAHLETIQPNGQTSYTIDLQKTKIKDGKHAFESVSTLRERGYLILHTLWFYDLKNNRQEIECNVAWFIK